LNPTGRRATLQPPLERGEVDHLWPEFLPGGQAVLFTITSPGGIDNAQVAVLDLKTGMQKVLVRGGSHARYVPSGHLVCDFTDERQPTFAFSAGLYGGLPQRRIR
jgi:hypothetical protein